VSPDDEVIKLINNFNTMLPFFIREHAELNVVQVISCFTWAHEPRGWFIKTKGVNRIDRKVAENYLRRELVARFESMR
jgi:hypothetical protein